MEAITWSRDFSIKNMQLDEQHELIFKITSLANDLALKVQDNNELHKDELKQILAKLFQYIKIHFRDEEKFMENIDFPLIEEHRKSHQILLKKNKGAFRTFRRSCKDITRTFLANQKLDFRTFCR